MSPEARRTVIYVSFPLVLTGPILQLVLSFSIYLAFHMNHALQSAVMAGLKVVPVKTHPDGNLNLEDLKVKAEKHKDKLAAFMVRTSFVDVVVC